MSWKNFFFVDYWFSQPRVLDGQLLWVWVSLFLVCILAGLIFLLARSRQTDTAARKILQRSGGAGLTMGLTGLAWFFLRQERVVFLGWRLWFLAWLIILAFWLYRILHYVFKRWPQIRLEHEARAQREKYLPAGSKASSKNN